MKNKLIYKLRGEIAININPSIRISENLNIGRVGINEANKLPAGHQILWKYTNIGQ